VDEQTSVRSEHGDRHRAVAEIRGADARARRHLDDPVELVDDVDEFLAVLSVAVKFLVRRKRPTMRR
jgi:hypothetical protein